MALAAIWTSFESEVENETESKPILVVPKDSDRFALPTDGRKADAVREKRRLLYAYLVAGPKVFFKSIRTISREMTVAWAWEDPKGWSPRTIYRLLADLQVLGLVEPAALRGFQGTRIRRMNKGYKPESGTSAPSQERRNHHKKTGDDPESGTSAVKMAPQAESGSPGAAYLAERGFVVEVNSKPSEDLSQDQMFQRSHAPEKQRVAPERCQAEKAARSAFREQLLQTYGYLESYVDGWLNEVDAKSNGTVDYQAAWDEQCKLDAQSDIGERELAAVFDILAEENCYHDGCGILNKLTVYDVMDIAGWDPSYSHHHFQRTLDLLVTDKAVRTKDSSYWIRRAA